MTNTIRRRSTSDDTDRPTTASLDSFQTVPNTSNVVDEVDHFIDEPSDTDKIINQKSLGGPKTRFLLSGLSVDETKLSALILCLLLAIIFGGVAYCLNGDISNNLTAIITTLIYSIAGVNITNSVIDKMGAHMSNSWMVHSNSKKSK